MKLSREDRVLLRELAQKVLHPFLYINHVFIPWSAGTLEEEGIPALRKMKEEIEEVLAFYEEHKEEE